MNKKNKIKTPKIRIFKIETIEQLKSAIENNENFAIHFYFGNSDQSPSNIPELKDNLINKKVIFALINVQSHPEIVSKMGIKNYPVTQFFKNGKLIITQSGKLHTSGWERIINNVFV